MHFKAYKQRAMKNIKRLSLYAAIICVLLLLLVFLVGFLFDSAKFEHKLTIQAPLEKAFDNIASHELKPKMYRNISAEETEILPFIEGNTSKLCYMTDELICFTEKIILLDSLKELHLQTTSNRFTTTSKIYFSSKFRTTGLHVKEEIHGRTAFDRAMLFLFKKPYLQQRRKFYAVMKSAVESTPDYNLLPEDIK